MTLKKLVRKTIQQSHRAYPAFLAEDYDGIHQYVMVSLSRASTSGALRARVSPGDVGTGVPALRGTQVVVSSHKGQLEVLSLGTQPAGPTPVIGGIRPIEPEPEPEPAVGITDTFTGRLNLTDWGTSEAGITYTHISVGTLHASVGGGVAALVASSPNGYFLQEALLSVPAEARPGFDATWQMQFNHDLHMMVDGPNSGGEGEYFYVYVGGIYLEVGKTLALGGYACLAAAGAPDEVGTHGVIFTSPFKVRLKFLNSSDAAAKIWQADDEEPLAWTVTMLDQADDIALFVSGGYPDWELGIAQQSWPAASEPLVVNVDDLDITGVPAL